ncbi:MAG: PQQ-binding-like beta-propeller repeat protein, partial [Verrucomicrobiota bacterium]
MTSLRTLILGGTKVSDRGLRHLRPLKNLETLHLWRTRITGKGLKEIVKLRRLKTLNVWNTDIDDKDLMTLRKMNSLSLLGVGRSGHKPPPVHGSIKPAFFLKQVTSSGVEKLRKALPETRIFFWGEEGASAALSNLDRPKPVPVSGRGSRSETPIPTLGTRPDGVDWDRFLGPAANGSSPETGLAWDWERERPRLVWQRPAGEGYSAPTISRGRLLLFDREEDQLRLNGLNSETGEPIWTFRTPTAFVDQLGYSHGPRATPVVDGNRVYVMGPDGMLICLTLLDGRELWRVDTAKQFGVIQYFFGAGSSPIVEGDLLIAIIGGSPGQAANVNLTRVRGDDSGIVAFDKWTGEVKYRITDALASFASPRVVTVGDRRWGLAFARGELIGFEPAGGAIDFRFPWKARIKSGVSAATPAVVGDEVFITEAYDPGGCLLKIRPGGHEVVWQDEPRKRERRLQSHWSTPVVHEGFLYGLSGRYSSRCRLRCVDWKTGEVQWDAKSRGLASLIHADGHLIVLTEYGVLHAVKADPEQYTPVARLTLREDPADETSTPLLKYPAWPAPVLSHGLLYLR